MDNEVGIYIYLQQADIESMDDGECAAVTVAQTGPMRPQLRRMRRRDLSA